MDTKLVRYSKFLSLVLRHQPEKIGLSLDAEGWAEVAQLLECARKNGVALTRALFEDVVEQNDKQRFALSEDGQRIRARQGHSIEVDLNLEPIAPPETLYHGTATRFLDSIRASGLVRGRRRHVHLSADEATAQKVGMRHGKPVVLTIRASAMAAQGRLFYRSENGVWLTESVPTEFILFPNA